MKDELREVQFKSAEDVWPIGEGNGRVSVSYDGLEATFTLTYHPQEQSVESPGFTQYHAVTALRDAGYTDEQIGSMLNAALVESKLAM